METARAIALFLLVDTFPGLVWRPFEKRQAAICHFSKEWVATPEGDGEDAVDDDGGDDLRDGGEGGDLL